MTLTTCRLGYIFRIIELLFTLCHCANIQGIAYNQTLTVGYSVPWERGWRVGSKIGSSIILGIREVERRQLLPGYRIEWIMRDGQCEPKRGTQTTVDMWASVRDLDAIIGPGCSVVCQPASLLAAAWGIPIFGYSCASPRLSDKATYPTFTRSVGTWVSRAPVYDILLDMLNWRRAVILTTPEDLYKLLSMAILREMHRNGKEATLQVVDSTMRGDKIQQKELNVLYHTLESMKQNFRIFMLMSYPQDTRNMLIACYDLGMMNGQYAFIILEYIFPEIKIHHAYRPEADGFIWDGVLGMGVQPPSGPAWDQYRQDVIDELQDPRFDSLPHLPPTASIDEVEVYAGLIHDAVLQWAIGVNKTLEQGYPPDDGFKITENIFNSMFEGITGTVVINDRGDRLENLRLVSVQNGEIVVLMEWVAAMQTMKKVYKADHPDDWSGIIWHGNCSKVPRDSPVCGWLGELCSKAEDNNKVISLALSVAIPGLFLILIVTIIVFIKRYRYESSLKEIMELIVSWESLKFSADKCRTGSSSSSVTEQDKVDVHESALLQDNFVTIHRLGTTTLNLQERKVLIDIKEINDLKHDNLNPFLGICHLAPNVCYLMAHATRGSVLDIIANEDIPLSTDFKISFVLDIASGMSFLHQSSIQYHGELTSAQCVVDNRWICKITGHGLRYIKRKYNSSKYTLTDGIYKPLWVAPECLRSDIATSLNSPVESVQKCDTFSFGIIMQEIFTRDVPYGSDRLELDVEEIINKVKAHEDPPFRPTIPEHSCSKEWLSLMERCWAEDPQERPTFTQVRLYIKKVYKHANLIDSMIRRLENYTRDLEERVSVRTRDLQTEKAKNDTLLEELLPASVAQQLATGKQPEPELFNNITLFFTDIVGFTKISSLGTPFQIVVMLNNMYTLFDRIMRKFDVYKIATIGDAYMVASGVPIRNGGRHAREACSAALALLDASGSFKIQHMPDEYLNIRIGIHSGPCVAAVTGVKMPRYFLFGDTVDIASKMESRGEPMKIQISESTQTMIKNEPEFSCEKRGQLDIKGKGSVITYWLAKEVRGKI